VTDGQTDRQTDRQNYDSQDRASIARAVKMRQWSYKIPEIFTFLTCFGVLLSTSMFTAIDSPW